MVTGWKVEGLVACSGPFRVGPVDLDLAPGSAWSIVGRSGAGKTTLLRGLAGLAPIAQGRVARGGESITSLAPEHRRVGYVPQGLGLLPHYTVRQNVAYPMALRQRNDPGRVAQLVDRFGLAALADRRPFQLSTGQQQRVAVARALAAEPELLIWDEPLSGLDVEARDALLGILGDIMNRERLPVVVVTHDPIVAFTVAERFVVLEAGRVAYAGPAAALAGRPTDRFVARFVGFENVLSIEDLHPPSPGPFLRWLGERAGPGGIAFRCPSVGPATAAGRWKGLVVRAGPGPGGFLAHVRVDGREIRTVSAGGEPVRPSTEVEFRLDDADVRPIGSGTPDGGAS